MSIPAVFNWPAMHTLDAVTDKCTKQMLARKSELLINLDIPIQDSLEQK